MKLEVRIERLGAQGDGVAQGPAGPLLGLTHFPGELVKRPGMDQAEPLATLESSPDRIAAVYRYFGTCGGCALQRMRLIAYLAWKWERSFRHFLPAGSAVDGGGGPPGAARKPQAHRRGAKDCDGLLQSGNVRARPARSRGWRYRVTRVTPVDQFMFSPHIELVAVLER